MIELEKTDVYGWEAAIRGMRNPMNSWEKSDSKYECGVDTVLGCPDDCNGLCDPDLCDLGEFIIGKADHDLMMRLAKGGSVHAKYRRMITVTVDITAPLYWWKEFDTYKVGTVANSCSTMHKIHDKEFTLDDFSCEHLINERSGLVLTDRDIFPRNLLGAIVSELNKCRTLYLETKDKKYWWQMIQILPTSYNQKRTVMMNYEVLVGMYRDRKNHKLDEWHTLCDWIRELPYSEIITGEVIGRDTLDDTMVACR